MQHGTGPVKTLRNTSRSGVETHPGVLAEINTDALMTELRESVEGEVLFEAGGRALYATDSSNYRQVPIGVVIPKSRADVLHTVAVCRKFGTPLLSRGAGTSLAGQCCNSAVIIDWTKYLHEIVELNPGGAFARVQPGAVCDQLRRAAIPYGLTWGPDPATHAYCTFGGMLGNNSCGVHSQSTGKADDNVIEMEVLLYDGTRMTVGWTDTTEMDFKISKGGREGEIYASVKSLRERYAHLIKTRYPNIPRRVSGYNLDQLLPGEDGRFNLARALVGTESTCVTILEAKVQLVPHYTHRVLVVRGYPDIFHAADDVAQVVSFAPIGLEGFDDVTTHNIEKKNLLQREYLSALPEGKGWLVVEFGGNTREEAADRATQMMQTFPSRQWPTMKMYADAKEQSKIWAIRESALGANSFVPGRDPAWEGWEDSAVSPEKLGGYLRDLQRLFTKYSYQSVLYGHFGQGCVHNRVNFDFRSPVGVKKWRAFMEEATDLVVAYGGSLSGEHGDGQARGEFLYKMFGPELIEAFREFKSIWDPDWKMNPGKIVDPYRIDENLRVLNQDPIKEPTTHFRFISDNRNFAQGVERCVGVGKCTRVSPEGPENTMCPSYMVTRDEKHSTRGRAHLLWEMLNGDVIKDGWRNENVKEALDLCLACKGCKSECPVNVDMATYKAEFMSHYWEGRLRPLNSYAFGWIDKWARLAAKAPRVANGLASLPVLGDLTKSLLGIPSERVIPVFARQTFREWFRRRAPVNQGNCKVLLWPDTFNNYFTPQSAKAAVHILEAAGFMVEIPEQQMCCGRPLYDHGFLAMAKSYLLRVLDGLKPQIEEGTPIVVLEPSCCSVFRDEMGDLLPDLASAQRLRQNIFTFPEFLESKASHYPLPTLRRKAIVQGHCHQKSVMRMKHEESLMRKMELDYRLLDSGCCGMAGAFGYEKEKYSVSIACGERILLPEVRKADPSTLIIADGFSCQGQIQQATGRKALHLAEVIQLAISEAR
jgi:FAD/FMN-containing dehydrogenase/Fe-S oxidoreductase